ncbi:MAG: hypothetical protein KDB23_29615 [Planctomycetales bacterium]|nr:hypothetical protein [Planctomycetales bacterium]
MRHNLSIEERLGELARELGKRPCVADKVATLIDSKPYPKPSRIAQTGSFRRSQWVVGGASAVAATVVVALVFLGLTASVSFAEVKAALKGIRSVIVTRTFTGTKAQHRMLASVDHDAYRTEFSDGAIFVENGGGKVLMLNTQDRTGRLALKGAEGMMSPTEYLKSLQSIETKAVRSLGKKKFGGRSLVGFELPPIEGAPRTIWVDPNTKLPVREEVGHVQPSPDAKLNYHVSAAAATADGIANSVATYEFNVEIADDAFSLSPTGYTIVDPLKSREVENTSTTLKKEVEDLSIIPGKGVGPVKFGMSREEVNALLGEPDVLLPTGDEQGNTGTNLLYFSLGLDIRVDSNLGVTTLTCVLDNASFADFRGRFKNGISMDSSPADIKRTFGQPLREIGSGDATALIYEVEKSKITIGTGNGGIRKVQLYAPR